VKVLKLELNYYFLSFVSTTDGEITQRDDDDDLYFSGIVAHWSKGKAFPSSVYSSTCLFFRRATPYTNVGMRSLSYTGICTTFLKIDWACYMGDGWQAQRNWISCLVFLIPILAASLYSSAIVFN